MIRLKGDCGFTLLEVLTVTALLAIGAGVSVWGVNRILPDLRLKAAVRGVKSDMQLARLSAIRHNTFIVSQFSTDENSYTIYMDDGGDDEANANNYQLDSGERTIKTIRLHPQIRISRARFGAVDGRFAFNGRGSLQGLAGGIYMRNTEDKHRGVAISRIGKITIKTSEDGAEWLSLN